MEKWIDYYLTYLFSSKEYIDEISKIDCYPQEKLKLAAEQYDSIYFSNVRAIFFR